MFERIKNLIEKFNYLISKQECYDEMERRGLAVRESCEGVVGGDSSTEYLNYSCIDCPYFVCRKEN